MAFNNGLMFSNNPSNFNGPNANGASGQVLYGQGTTATPIWQNATSLPSPPPVISNYFQGYMGASGYWSVSSATYANLSNNGGNTLTTLYIASGFSLAAAGNSLCGVVLTPAYASAVYEITATTQISVSVANNSGTYRLTDGSTPMAFAACNENITTAESAFPATFHAYYCGQTTSPITFSIQARTSSGTAYLGSNWASGSDSNVPSVVWSFNQIA